MSAFYGRDLNPDTDNGEPPLIVGRGWSQRRGPTVTLQWTGSPARISAVESAQRLLKRDTDVQMPDDGSPWVLRAITPEDETQGDDEINLPIKDKWLMTGEEMEVKLWELPEIQAEFDKVGDNEVGSAFAKINSVRTAIEAFVAGTRKITDLAGEEQDVTEGYLDDLVSGYDMDFEPFRVLIELLARGIESKWYSVYVLKHTRVYADGSNFKIEEYDDVLKTLSTEQLTTREQIPTTLKFLLPPGRWIKKTPTVEQDDSAVRNWHFNEEWLFVTGAAGIEALYPAIP